MSVVLYLQNFSHTITSLKVILLGDKMQCFVDNACRQLILKSGARGWGVSMCWEKKVSKGAKIRNR